MLPRDNLNGFMVLMQLRDELKKFGQKSILKLIFPRICPPCAGIIRRLSYGFVDLCYESYDYDCGVSCDHFCFFLGVRDLVGDRGWLTSSFQATTVRQPAQSMD